MAAPAQINTLRSTDFPKGVSDKATADKLFQILNPFLQQVGSVTTAGTALGQNVDGQLVTLEFTTPATDWITVGASGAPAYQNSWATFGGGYVGAMYRRDALGTVWVIGRVHLGTPGTTVFTLPVGFRPANTFLVAERGNTAFSSIQVTVAGLVQQIEGTTDDLSLTASFPEASNTPGVYSCFPLNVRLKDGKKPAFVIARVVDTKANQVVAVVPPAWTALGTGATGNQLRIDNIPGLSLGTKYSANLFVFF